MLPKYTILRIILTLNNYVMKNQIIFATIAIALVISFSLTSCRDEDFGVSTAMLQEKAFEHDFVNEFGQPSADQNWDFYAQQMEAIRQGSGTTRSTMDGGITVDFNINQPTDTWFKNLVDEWQVALEEKLDNSRVGQNNYTLTSTGDFKIYAVRYAGAIEFLPTFNLDFGIAYIDKTTNNEIMVPLFGRSYKNDEYRKAAWAEDHNTGYGNPGWAAEVKIPKNQTFYFYLRYDYYPYGYWHSGGYWVHDPNVSSNDEGWHDVGQYVANGQKDVQTFYSNEIPSFKLWNGNLRSYPEYGGMSTLLYSTEHIDDVTGKDEQVMMIGIEDAWGHEGTENTQDISWFDKDFNDIVVLIEGELPVPSAKRFFIEDKTSFDWDYNDVVFDVMNTGIVLRALGGTLPVFLRITDRQGNTTTTGELHELMQSIQPQLDKRDYILTYDNGDGKTLYKPIDVAANPGLWFDPVQIITWTSLGTSTNNTRLEEGEVERFANPLATNKVGNVELIVLPEYSSSGYDLSNVDALATLSEDTKRPLIIPMSEIGSIPAIWSGPVSINWMKELQKITLGYGDFYGGNIQNGEPLWWQNNTNSNYWYLFSGDVDPDAH